MALVLSESAKIAIGTFYFIRSMAKALITYVEKEKSPTVAQLKGVGLQNPLPEKLPSIIEIKRALPMECFQPKVSTSMYYAVRDVIQVIVCFLVFFYLDSLITSYVGKALLMLLYWAIQGTFLTAIFVIGHDCGHGSFSDYSLLNDVVGTFMHGLLLAPYYMWKLSHRQHHKNNANIEKDEVFYPVRESEPCAKAKVMPAFGFGTGWFGYLALGYNPRPRA